ncbi:hypothetical protein ACFFMP_14060 [Pseudoroseomonas cervicalis]|uniref:hypothetical protein n=1 Tax=Teichococcus cervicalis TaxID=204525 RepID=UPI0035F09BC1
MATAATPATPPVGAAAALKKMVPTAASAVPPQFSPSWNSSQPSLLLRAGGTDCGAGLGGAPVASNTTTVRGPQGGASRSFSHWPARQNTMAEPRSALARSTAMTSWLRSCGDSIIVTPPVGV